LLFEFGVATVKLVDVVGAAEPGLTPCLLAQCFGEPVTQLCVLADEPVDAIVCACEISDQGGSAGCWPSGRCGGWFGGFGQDHGV
jgi:hypothetical protein